MPFSKILINEIEAIVHVIGVIAFSANHCVAIGGAGASDPAVIENIIGVISRQNIAQGISLNHNLRANQGQIFDIWQLAQRVIDGGDNGVGSAFNSAR